MLNHQFLSRFIWILLLTAVVLSALTFPLHITAPYMFELEKLDSKSSFAGWLYQTQLRFQLAYAIGPLLYKETLAAALIMMAFVVFVVHVAVAPARPLDTRPRWKRWIASPEVWLMALVVYSAASILEGWSPTPSTSMRTWVLMTAGISAIFMVRQIQLSQAQIRAFMICVIAAGWVIATIALLQHFGKMPFLPVYPDPRNRMSSLIGHNTGMSAFLLFPLSFSFYRCVVARGRIWRTIPICGIALMLLVILLAQSRAVWSLTAILLFVWFRHCWKYYQFRITARQGLLAVLAIMILISGRFIHPKLDLFGRAPITVYERLKKDVFNLDQLRRETRLRIAVVSFSELIPDKLMFGHGIGSFQWVYPIAQGQYFQKHFLDTKLGTTSKRTDLAHNDPLQLWIELGLVGVVLTGGAVFLLLRQGRRNSRKVPLWFRSRNYALLTPVALIALHSLVDFPFHIVPIALLAVLALGIYSVGAQSKSIDQPNPAASAILSGFAMALISAVPATATLRYVLLPDFVADIYASNGMNWLTTGRDLPTSETDLQMEANNQALSAFRSALQSNILYGAAYEGRASASIARSRLNFIKMQDALKEGNQQAADMYKAEGMVDAERTLQDSQIQIERGELQYHHTYYTISNAYRMLWRFDPDEENIRQMNYLKSSELALQRALEFNIADTNSLFEMGDLLDNFPTPRTAEADRYRRLLIRLDPTMARITFFDPVRTLAIGGELDEAWKELQRLTRQFPANPDLTATRALLHLYEAAWPPPEIDRATSPSVGLAYRRETLAPVWALLPAMMTDSEDELYRRDHLALLANAAVANWKATEETADKILAYRRNDVDAKVLKNHAISKINNTKEVEETSYEYYRRRGLLGVYFLDDKQDSVIQTWDTVQRVRPRLPEGRRLVAYFKANDLWQYIDGLLALLLHYYPQDPVFLSAMEEAKQRKSTTQTTATETLR